MGDEVFLILAGFVHPHPKRKAHIHTLHPGANELSRNDAPEPAVRAVARVMETAGSLLCHQQLRTSEFSLPIGGLPHHAFPHKIPGLDSQYHLPPG